MKKMTKFLPLHSWQVQWFHAVQKIQLLQQQMVR